MTVDLFTEEGAVETLRRAGFRAGHVHTGGNIFVAEVRQGERIIWITAEDGWLIGDYPNEDACQYGEGELSTVPYHLDLVAAVRGILAGSPGQPV